MKNRFQILFFFSLAFYSCDDNQEEQEKLGCLDNQACNYDSDATINNNSCLYLDCKDECGGSALVDSCGTCDDDLSNDCTEDCAGEWGSQNICGCTDITATNYNSDATFDDGSCEYQNGGTIPGRNIYIVGESYNSNGEWTSCYWLNGERIELPGGYTATDITVIDGVVYTSGTADGACYWIDQQRFDLPGDFSEGEAIAVSGENIYVAGWFDNGSCYWENGEKINLTVNRDSQAFSIGVRNNGSVYIGGYYMNNHHYYIPCFWKDGNNRTNLSIPTDGDGEVYDIAFMDGNMRYYAGYVLKTSGFAGYTPTACYWRHTTRTDMPFGGSNMDIYGSGAYGISIDGDDVYLAGYTDWFEDTNNPYTTGGSFPQYWENNTIHDLQGGPITEFGTGIAHDIAIADGNVLVVGEATRDTSYYDSYTSACFWLNGELFYLISESDVQSSQEDWYHSVARGVFIE
tara:strand:+ start:207 stop:1583 length:1377 start_codon:yes stop_codon:yes gene_type:complete